MVDADQIPLLRDRYLDLLQNQMGLSFVQLDEDGDIRVRFERAQKASPGETRRYHGA